MARLLIHVEGESEETFVNEVLRNHLASVSSHAVSARIVGNARQRHRRGGIRGWDSVKKDIVRHLRYDNTLYTTTMVDYYALPKFGVGAWPGREIASTVPISLKSQTVENALAADIQAEMGGVFEARRFIPFVVMHEFEGLLFSDCAAFSRAIGQPTLQSEFQTIRNDFNNPEEINDSPQTAPSKRIEVLIPNYNKPLFGTIAILEITLDRIRAECPHFNQWVTKLENIP